MSDAKYVRYQIGYKNVRHLPSKTLLSSGRDRQGMNPDWVGLRKEDSEGQDRKRGQRDGKLHGGSSLLSSVL